MKKSFSILAASLLLAFSAYADDAHHPEKKAEAAAAAKPTAPAPAKVAAPAVSNADVGKLQINVKKMRSQLDTISKTKNPEARQKLLAEHMQTIHENMMTTKGMMAGNMDCPMMKGGMGMKGGMMMDHGSAGGGQDAMMMRMQQMEKRMDMMEKMGKPGVEPMPRD